MKKLVALLLVVGLLGVTNGYSPSARAEKEPAPKASNKDKLVGKWALEKTTGKGGIPPGGAVMDLAKDGKIKLTAAGMTINGAYKVDGDKVVITLKAPNGAEIKETLTITKLTDKELVTKDTKGEVDTYKKK